MKLEKTASIVVTALLALMLFSCANIGRPNGGPRDERPPVYVDSKPAPNQLNFNGEKIEILFDEYIQLKDQTTKVVVSPAQKNMPIIRGMGKKVTVELRDSLIPNTTYCIDFGNAIQDNNEGNPLEDFAFAFSTGDSIDTLQVSGIMLNARNLEPMQSTIVGLLDNLEDSAFSTIPLDRIARTNELGQFTIRNLKPGRYHVFGLKDMDGDYKFARSEDLAFYDDVVVPSCYFKETTDTVFKYNGEIDTIMPGKHTVFTPNNVLLSMFNEEYRSLYMRKNERPTEGKLHILFSAPTDTLPELRVIKPSNVDKRWYRLQRTATNDSLFYWLTDCNMIKSDSILIEARYLHSDSLDNIVMTTDTLKFNINHAKLKKRQEKKKEDEVKSNAKKTAPKKNKKRSDKSNDAQDDDNIPAADSVPELPKSRFDSIPPIKATFKSSVDYGEPLLLSFDTPIDSINQAAVHLFVKEDTVWNTVDKPYKLEPFDSLSIMEYKIDYPFEAGTRYKVEVDSMSIFNCYGNMNKSEKVEFAIPALEEYSNLFFNVNVQDSAFVELLNNSDKAVKTAPVEKGTAAFENIKPGTYYARLVLDANGNGKWDTGNYALHLQPEEVYYYPKKINLKKNWDVEQAWNIYEVALDKQKPEEIKKNKPKPKKGQVQKGKNNRNRNGNNNFDEEEGDEDDAENWGVSGFNRNGYTGNRYNDSRNGIR